jgi:HSP20 family protein
MLLRFDPFRDVERVRELTRTRSPFMPLDAYRRGDEFVLRADLPGVDPASIDLLVDGNVLTIKAQRSWTPADSDKVVAVERARGTFTRRLVLGDALDPSGIAANYEHGVLTVTVPVAEKAKPRKVEITVGGAADSPAIEEGEGSSESQAA